MAKSAHEQQLAGDKKVAHAVEQMVKKADIVLKEPVYNHIDIAHIKDLKRIREELKHILAHYKRG